MLRFESECFLNNDLTDRGHGHVYRVKKVLKVLLLSTPKKVPVNYEIVIFRGEFFSYVQQWSSRPVVIRMFPFATPLRASRRGTLYNHTCRYFSAECARFVHPWHFRGSYYRLRTLPAERSSFSLISCSALLFLFLLVLPVVS